MAKFGRRKFSIKRIILKPPKGYDNHWRKTLGPSPMVQLAQTKFSWRKLFFGF